MYSLLLTPLRSCQSTARFQQPMWANSLPRVLLRLTTDERSYLQQITGVVLLVPECPLDDKKQQNSAYSPYSNPHNHGHTHCTLVHTYLQWQIIYNLWSFHQSKPPTTCHPHRCLFAYLPPVSMKFSFLQKPSRIDSTPYFSKLLPSF